MSIRYPAPLGPGDRIDVEDRLPKKLRSVVAKRMRVAYRAETALAARAQLQALAGELERTHLGAAASLREGWRRR